MGCILKKLVAKWRKFFCRHFYDVEVLNYLLKTISVAPILTLPLSPPPPPLLETGLTNPNCSQNQALANLTAQWRQACRIVVAYPPVPAYHHVWNWSNGEAALYAIRSAISPHLTEEKVEALEQVIQQAAAEQYSGGCSGLLVRQNASTFPSHHTPTLFWCYAENEVGKTVVRWPQQYQKSRCKLHRLSISFATIFFYSFFYFSSFGDSPT